MTVCLAMHYDKGVLLASDSLGIVANKDKVGDVTKLLQVRSNLILGFSGIVANQQYFLRKFNQDLLAMDNLLTSYVKKRMEALKKEDEEQWKKMAGLSYAQQILEFTGGDGRLQIANDSRWIIRRAGENIPYSFEQQPVPLENSIIYEAKGEEVLTNVESMLGLLQSKIIHTTIRDTSFLCIGYDREGYALYFLDSGGGLLKVKDFYAIGSSERYAKGRCKILYHHNLSLESAVEVALFSMLNADEFDTGVNNKFQVASLQEKNGLIEANRLSDDEVLFYAQRALNLEETIRNIFK